MPSSLISTDVPKTVTSGVAFSVSVTFQSTTGGTLEIDVDAGFSVSPASYDLTASVPGSVTFSVAITRDDGTNAGTELDLTFGNEVSVLIDKVQ